MTTLSYTALAEKLPTGSIEFVGNNQVKLNLTFATESGANLTLDSSCVKGVVNFMQALSSLTDQVNEARINVNLPPI